MTTSLKIYHGAAKPIAVRGVNVCHLLSFAHAYRGWHTFKADRATRRAIATLQRLDCIEVQGNQFRFQYPKG